MTGLSLEIRNHLAAPVTLLALFLLVTGIPLATVVWLGWRLLDQDRALESQRIRERLDEAAALISRELERSLGSWTDLLTPASRREVVTLPREAVALVIDSKGIVHQQGVRLPFYPSPSSAAAPDQTLFAEGEAHEFRAHDLPKAAVSYRSAANTPNPAVRAGALMRLARVHRKQQNVADAIAAYGELATLGDTPIGGATAELVGRRERLALLHDRDLVAREQELLGAALFSGGVALDRATFDFYRASLPPAFAPPGTTRLALALAEGVDDMWPLWQQQSAGRAAARAGEFSLVAVWRRTDEHTTAIVGRADDLIVPAKLVLDNLDVRLVLEDPSGRVSWGAPLDEANRVTRTARETDLPWTMHLALADSDNARAISMSRRNVFATGFVVMLLAVAGASYFVFRSVKRELEIARLQSDFVAAVSHEFRTPLTAMCHLTEMLESGTSPPERRPLYYEALARESRRLRAMVESLLDFGRIDAGRREYQFLETDPTELVEQVVQECRDRMPSAGRIDWQPQGTHDPIRIRADRDALALALRNLLDNASKYSPESARVRVFVEPQGPFVGIAIQDEGIGIPKHEQRSIFRKFTRGSSARALNVKGTGIGLTMAAQIVKAHGGRLTLESEPGRGSRFTALIPVQASHS